MNRRQIIKTSALAGAGVALPIAGVVASAAHQPVINALGAFSDRIVANEGANEVHIVASLDRMKQFCDDETRSRAFPYENIRAEGNVLSFTHEGTAYRVENVLAADFDARARSLS